MVDISSARITSIGPSMLVRGNLQGDEDLTVLGRVEGSIQLRRALIVENGGIVKADIDVENAVISGIVVGNIVASDSIEITESGRVVGDIAAPRVLIVDGAQFRGLVDMGDLDAPRATAPLPVRSATPVRSLARRTTAPAASSLPARRPPPPPPARAPTPTPTPTPTPPVVKRPPAAAVSPEAHTPDKEARDSGVARRKKKSKKKVVLRKKKRR